MTNMNNMAIGLRRQIFVMIGIDSHECIHLARLVRQGPWELAANSRRIRLVMEGAFAMLLWLAAFYEDHDCKAFLTDLTRVNSAWWLAGPHDQGRHGWSPLQWQDRIDSLYEARRSSLTSRSLNGSNTGRCAFEACLGPCEKVLVRTKKHPTTYGIVPVRLP
jgi:hypothetical protein